MVFDGKALLPSDRGNLVFIEAEVQVDHPMAFRARQVVMMAVIPAKSEIVRPISKVDPVEHLHMHELLHGSIDSGAPDSRIGSVQSLDEILRGEHGAGFSQPYQAPRDSPARLRAALAELIEGRRYPFFDVHLTVSEMT